MKTHLPRGSSNLINVCSNTDESEPNYISENSNTSESEANIVAEYGDPSQQNPEEVNTTSENSFKGSKIYFDLNEVESHRGNFGTLSIYEDKPVLADRSLFSALYGEAWYANPKFESSLPVLSAEDFDAYVELSNRFCLPLSLSGITEFAESCVYIDSSETRIKFAWNSFQSPEQDIKEILLSVVNDAVDISSINDPTLDNDGLSSVVDAIMKVILLSNEYHTAEGVDQLSTLGHEAGTDNLIERDQGN